jgi:hypothetical protein
MTKMADVKSFNGSFQPPTAVAHAFRAAGVGFDRTWALGFPPDPRLSCPVCERRAFIALSNVFNYRATHLSYMMVHDGSCLLCVAAFARCKDGPMLFLGLGRLARLDLNRKEMQIVLRAVA